MELPYRLIENVRAGKVVLVMGAGASLGALTSAGQSAPTGPRLARLLAKEFLGAEHSSDPLSIVSELSISESDLFFGSRVH